MIISRAATIIDPADVTAICAAMGVFSGIFLFSVNAIVSRQFSKIMEKIEGRFASRDHVNGLEIRIQHLESPHSRSHHAGGD